MRELNFTAHAEKRRLVVTEGQPTSDRTARCFTLVYPETRILIWITSEISPKQMQSIIHDALHLANSAPVSSQIAVR